MQKDELLLNDSKKSQSFTAYWAFLLGNILYIKSTASPSIDNDMRTHEQKEGSNPLKRDLRGFDFITWTYDLFNPNESFENARRNHSLGGKSRGVYFDQLSSEERSYLKKQANLSFLSLLDPTLFRKNYFGTKEKLYNVNLKHHLTSFGHSIDFNFFYKNKKLFVYSKLMFQKNINTYFPGLEAQIIEYPLEIKSKLFLLTPRLSIFTGPKGQDFRTKSHDLGFLTALKVGVPWGKKVVINSELQYKSEGWIAGIAALTNEAILNLGVSVKL